MPNTVHHRQIAHAAAHTVVANPPALPAALPWWTQTPCFYTFAPCFVVLALLAIRHRRNLYRRGERFTTRKTKPAEYLTAALFCGGLFYLRDKLPIVPLVMEWPDRHFPYYHAHGLAMWLGFCAAVLAASMISALYAALFLRGGGGPRGGFTTAIAQPELVGIWRRTTRTITYEE